MFCQIFLSPLYASLRKREIANCLIIAFLFLKKSLLSSPTQYRMLIQPSIVTHCGEMMIKVPIPGFDKYILLDMPSPINVYTLVNQSVSDALET